MQSFSVAQLRSGRPRPCATKSKDSRHGSPARASSPSSPTIRPSGRSPISPHCTPASYCSAYTSLATLYAKVPGWPVGFGDKAKAEELFKKSLAINPDGIDPNFFYGEYLVDRERFAEARTHLETALKAALRPGRELGDSGRRKEFSAMLEKLVEKLEKEKK